MIETIFALFAFSMGASVGSFLNVVADRLPSGKSVVTPRSHCQGCARPIPVRDLLPVLSYLWLRGRCSHCRQRIPTRVIAVEVLVGALFAASYLKFGWGAPVVVACAGVTLLMVVAVIDLEHRLIPNRLVVPAVAVLAVLAPFWPELGIERALVFEQVHLSSLANSLAAGGGALLVFLAVKAAYPAGMGAGDVKMAGMLGLLVGYPGIAVALWTAVVVGGVVAVGLLALGGRSRKDAMPFGPFLSAGGIVALLASTEIIDFYFAASDRLIG
ncbi:MAG: prepilin peptidase [Chloroflexota bacterium]|nr:prepilin peptidase [Chloroflexota bacterium]